jgi:5'-3' exoribonuclease 1
MGVPGFVAWLYNNHKSTNFIFKKLFKTSDLNNLNDIRVNSVQNLFLDTNCLIHPKAKEVYMNNLHLVESNIELLENKIIQAVISYIELIIEQVKPTKVIYIAVDGVAPMAKIKHQRIRRFKSIYDQKIKEDLCNKHKRTIVKEWNTAAITPGTLFMDKLMKAILIWTDNTKYKNIIFSSCYTPGEGEHKIIQYIRNNNIKDDVNIIYGLDADLLFLSLSLNQKNIYLMRETSQMEINKYNYDDDFSYLSIDILGDTIYNVIVGQINNKKKYNRVGIINDFVFLCYFCGNDFLPNIPSLNLKPHNRKIKNGINIIVDTYSEIMHESEEYLIENMLINKRLFLKILEILSKLETEYFKDVYNTRRNFMNCKSNDPYEIDKHNYDENIIFNYNDPIELGNPKDNLNIWKFRYYNHYHNIKIKSSNDNSLNIILEEYIRGLVWTTFYYYDRCKDYEWYYDFHHGPFISDLKNYIERKPDIFNEFEKIYKIDGIWFKNQIKPLHQLLLVLPHESSYLIPSSYRVLLFSNKLKKYFSNKITDIKIDYINKSKGWQNILLLDIIPPNIILKLTSKIILNEELERNKLCLDYIKN